MTNKKDDHVFAWKHIFICFAIGTLFSLVTFPNLIDGLVKEYIKSPGIRTILLSPLCLVQTCWKFLVGDHPVDVYKQLMLFNIFVFWSFIAITILLSVRHMKIKYPGFAFLGIIIGFLSFHILLWPILIVIYLATEASSATVSLFGLLRLLIEIISITTSGLSSHAWGLIIGVAVAFVAILIRKKLYIIASKTSRYIAKRIKKILYIVFALCALMAVIPLVISSFSAFYSDFSGGKRIIDGINEIGFLTAIGDFFGEYILPGSLGVLNVLYIFGVVLIIALLSAILFSIIGGFIADQLASAVHSYRGAKQLAICGFTIGASFSLLTIISAFSPLLTDFGFWGLQLNRLGISKMFVDTLPQGVNDIIFRYFTATSAPIFDAILLSLTLTISCICIIKNFISYREGSTEVICRQFFTKEIFFFVGGMLLFPVLLFVQTKTEIETLNIEEL